jgi:hypothetical protein
MHQMVALKNFKYFSTPFTRALANEIWGTPTLNAAAPMALHVASIRASWQAHPSAALAQPNATPTLCGIRAARMRALNASGKVQALYGQGG